LSTSKHAGTINFENTLNNLGYYNHPLVEIVPLGRGEKFTGWKYRMKKYFEYCKSLPANEIVLLTDADDVLFCRKFDGLIETFEKHQKPIIIGAQFGLNRESPLVYPIFSYIKQHPEAEGFEVNGGGLIGYASSIAALYAWALSHPFTDDQRMLGAYLNSHVENIYLDINSDIFYLLHAYDKTSEVTWTHGSPQEVKSIVRTGNFLHTTPLTCRPYLIHFASQFYNPTWLSVLFGKSVQHADYEQIAKQLLNHEYVQHHYSSTAFFQIAEIWWTTIACMLIFTIAFGVILILFIRKRKRILNNVGTQF